MPEINLYSLHPKQLSVKNDPARFKILNFGRRFGKTILLENDLIEPAIGYDWSTRSLVKPRHTSFYSYSYKTIKDTWVETKKILEGAISHKDETIKQMTLYSGVNIDFWSAMDPRNGRGKKYGQVVGDEVAFWKNQDKLINETILPTLADYQGKLTLASTPYGMNNWWHRNVTEPKKHWKSFHGTIYDNPFIKREEIEILREATPPDIFNQEYMAMFVDTTGSKWISEYDDELHYGEENFELGDYPTWVTFDFNHSPCTASVYQDVHGVGILGYNSYKQNGGTRKLCKLMKQDEKLMGLDRLRWTVTGDSNGKNKTSTGGDTTDYGIIQEEFGLRNSQIVNVQSRNKELIYSRRVNNEFLRQIPFRLSNRMQDLRNDFLIAREDKNGNMYKNREDGHALDFLDHHRYFVHALCPFGLEDIKRLKVRFKNQSL